MESYNPGTGFVLWMGDKLSRLAALTTARSEAVRMFGLIPTPQMALPAPPAEVELALGASHGLL